MIERVQSDLRTARLARDSKRVGALTMLLTSLQTAAKDAGGELSEQETITVLRRERKRRDEAAASFREGGREEQAAAEEFEAELIGGYLPAALDPAELLVTEGELARWQAAPRLPRWRSATRCGPASWSNCSATGRRPAHGSHAPPR